MPQRRKRSAAITLVLAGSLGGCSEPVPQRDVYNSAESCRRDWPQGQQCEPVRDGRYSSGWYYGPSHYGASWPNGQPRPSANAIDTVKTRSPVSRSGFGSTGRSSIS